MISSNLMKEEAQKISSLLLMSLCLILSLYFSSITALNLSSIFISWIFGFFIIIQVYPVFFASIFYVKSYCLGTQILSNRFVRLFSQLELKSCYLFNFELECIWNCLQLCSQMIDVLEIQLFAEAIQNLIHFFHEFCWK